jgi:hypothetical protein
VSPLAWAAASGLEVHTRLNLSKDALDRLSAHLSMSASRAFI